MIASLVPLSYGITLCVKTMELDGVALGAARDEDERTGGKEKVHALRMLSPLYLPHISPIPPPSQPRALRHTTRSRPYLPISRPYLAHISQVHALLRERRKEVRPRSPRCRRRREPRRRREARSNGATRPGGGTRDAVHGHVGTRNEVLCCACVIWRVQGPGAQGPGQAKGIWLAFTAWVQTRMVSCVSTRDDTRLARPRRRRVLARVARLSARRRAPRGRRRPRARARDLSCSPESRKKK